MRAAAALLLAGISAACAPRIDSLERALAAQESATAALGQWCRARQLADPPVISARRMQGPPSPVPAEVRKLLSADGAEAIEYRHVRLTCGENVLSVAHNWYVPGRLTTDMNAALATSDTPFGKVVAPLGFRRERLASQRGPAEGCPPDTILAHRALLRLRDGRPLSLVVECYTPANLE